MNPRTIFADKKIQFDETTLKELIKEVNEKVENEILKLYNWKKEDFLNTQDDDDRNKTEDSEEEESFPETFCPKYSVKLDENALSNLLNKSNVEVPQKFSDLQTKFSREEKLHIYEYVVKQAPNNIRESNSNLVEQERQFADMVTTVKREKKRRRKYRIMKPTYMEELRAVVDMQMQALQRCHEEENRKRKRHQNRRRSPSPSRRRHSYKKKS